MQRCYNPNRPKYKSYGARGITVCEEWKSSFKTFYDWAMGNGYQEELTIDRINNDGNYEPSNCRWSTWQEQSYNKTTSRFITYKGETKTVAEWSKIKGIKRMTICSRLDKGWSVEKTLETPVLDYKEAPKIPISQYSIDNCFIRNWSSAVDAGRTLKINSANINWCCRQHRKTAGGFIWKYREE